MPLRRVGVTKREVQAALPAIVNVMLPTQQVTTNSSTGVGVATFAEDVDSTSVTLTVMATGTDTYTVQLTSVVGKVVTFRTEKVTTAILVGGRVTTPASTIVNVNARKKV